MMLLLHLLTERLQLLSGVQGLFGVFGSELNSSCLMSNEIQTNSCCPSLPPPPQA